MRHFPRLPIVAFLIVYLLAACTAAPAATPVTSAASPAPDNLTQRTTEPSHESTLSSTSTSSLMIKAATTTLLTVQPTPSPESRLTPLPQTLVPTPIGVTGSGLPKGHFVVGDRPFQFLGAVVASRWHYDFLWSERAVDDLVASAKAHGVNVLELNPLPVEPPHLEVYPERLLARLDYLLDSAYRSGLYVSVSFVHGLGISLSPNALDYDPRGIEGLIKDEIKREAFRKRIGSVISRVNTVNGKKYSERSHHSGLDDSL